MGTLKSNYLLRLIVYLHKKIMRKLLLVTQILAIFGKSKNPQGIELNFDKLFDSVFTYDLDAEEPNFKLDLAEIGLNVVISGSYKWDLEAVSIFKNFEIFNGNLDVDIYLKGIDVYVAKIFPGFLEQQSLDLSVVDVICNFNDRVGKVEGYSRQGNFLFSNCVLNSRRVGEGDIEFSNEFVLTLDKISTKSILDLGLSLESKTNGDLDFKSKMLMGSSKKCSKTEHFYKKEMTHLSHRFIWPPVGCVIDLGLKFNDNVMTVQNTITGKTSGILRVVLDGHEENELRFYYKHNKKDMSLDIYDWNNGSGRFRPFMTLPNLKRSVYTFEAVADFIENISFEDGNLDDTNINVDFENMKSHLINKYIKVLEIFPVTLKNLNIIIYEPYRDFMMKDIFGDDYQQMFDSINSYDLLNDFRNQMEGLAEDSEVVETVSEVVDSVESIISIFW